MYTSSCQQWRICHCSFSLHFCAACTKYIPMAPTLNGTLLILLQIKIFKHLKLKTFVTKSILWMVSWVQGLKSATSYSSPSARTRKKDQLIPHCSYSGMRLALLSMVFFFFMISLELLNSFLVTTTLIYVVSTKAQSFFHYNVGVSCCSFGGFTEHTTLGIFLYRKVWGFETFWILNNGSCGC